MNVGQEFHKLHGHDFLGVIANRYSELVGFITVDGTAQINLYLKDGPGISGAKVVVHNLNEHSEPEAKAQ